MTAALLVLLDHGMHGRCPPRQLLLIEEFYCNHWRRRRHVLLILDIESIYKLRTGQQHAGFGCGQWRLHDANLQSQLARLRTGHWTQLASGVSVGTGAHGKNVLTCTWPPVKRWMRPRPREAAALHHDSKSEKSSSRLE
jgi:hypothetical protein